MIGEPEVDGPEAVGAEIVINAVWSPRFSDRANASGDGYLADDVRVAPRSMCVVASQPSASQVQVMVDTHVDEWEDEIVTLPYARAKNAIDSRGPLGSSALRPAHQRRWRHHR